MADDATPGPALSPPVPKPAHVPEALVYDFDLFADPGLLADSHARILEIAANAPPIFWTPRLGGHWVFAGHEANFEGSRDWESFTSEFVPQAQIQAMMAMMPPGSPHIPQPLPINVDPPLHGKFRMPLNAVYEWTSDGLRWGLDASGSLAESLLNGRPDVSLVNSDDARGAAAMAAIFLVIVVSPTIIGTAGGSAVGLADGMRLSAQELAKRMAGTRERVVAYTAYSYDAHDRLVLARLYAVEGGRELVRTEYRYGGDAAVPARAEITNLQDGKTTLLE